VVIGAKKIALGWCDLPTKQVTWNMLKGANWSRLHMEHSIFLSPCELHVGP